MPWEKHPDPAVQLARELEALAAIWFVEADGSTLVGKLTPGIAAALLSAEREAEKRTVQEAAKVLCEWCRDPFAMDNATIGPTMRTLGAWRHPVKWHSGGEADIGCAAHALLDRFPSCAPSEEGR